MSKRRTRLTPDRLDAAVRRLMPHVLWVQGEQIPREAAVLTYLAETWGSDCFYYGKALTSYEQIYPELAEADRASVRYMRAAGFLRKVGYGKNIKLVITVLGFSYLQKYRSVTQIAA